MDRELDVLHALRVKGLAKPEVLAALAGVDPGDLSTMMPPLVEAGLVRELGGAMAGFMPTPAGKAAAQARLEATESLTADRQALAAFDEEFLPVNSEFKALCHRWQMRGDETPNDHTDAAHDAAVVADLAAFHERFVPELTALADDVPRFGRYVPRLAAALDRVRAGDVAAFARPMADSYHDIWMELHNDVVLTLGRERSAADESVH